MRVFYPKKILRGEKEKHETILEKLGTFDQKKYISKNMFFYSSLLDGLMANMHQKIVCFVC